MKKAGKKKQPQRCKTKGCRKIKRIGDYCLDCAKKMEKKADNGKSNGKSEVSVFDDLSPLGIGEKYLSPIEAESWGRVDAEIRALVNERQVIALQQQQDEIQHKERSKKRMARIAAIENDIKIKNNSYGELIKRFSKKYNIPISEMALDVDARIIRNIEHLSQTPKGS